MSLIPDVNVRMSVAFSCPPDIALSIINDILARLPITSSIEIETREVRL